MGRLVLLTDHMLREIDAERAVSDGDIINMYDEVAELLFIGVSGQHPLITEALETVFRARNKTIPRGNRHLMMT